jgi:hypothetical protein
MRNLRAILFPHASLPEKMLKRALSFLGPLKICRPWGMDRAVSLAEERAIQLLRPPFELEPSIDLEKLLAEHRTWIRMNQKRGFDALLVFSHERLQTGEAVWDIRGSLRSKQNSDVVPREDKILKWNLMLHMAQEIEDQKQEADRLLADLRKKSSPLRDLLDDGVDLVHPLADLPQFDGELSRRSLDQVLEAWIFLFEGHIEEGDLLLTFSGEIFQHLEERWEERRDDAPSLTMELRSPDFSHLGFGELAEAKNRFFESKEGISIRDSVMEFGKGVPVKSAGKAPCLPGVPGKMMKIILRCFPHIPISSDPVSRFSGKTVAFIGEDHLHDG